MTNRQSSGERRECAAAGKQTGHAVAGRRRRYLDRKILTRAAAFFLCAGVLLSVFGAQELKPEAAEVRTETPELKPEAAEVRTETPELKPEAAEDIVLIRVEADPEEIDREALLERINAIRREACEEGIDNPVNGIPLTAADYAPLQWSDALEEIAVLRAAESTILQDHIRPDGRECFTAAPEGVSYTMETLAWGFESAADAVEGWYSEKTSYVEADGRPAGHYMALINPQNRFVGIAGLRAQWQRNACAGAFGNYASPGESGASEKATVWTIPLRREYLDAVIGRAAEVTAGRICRAASKLTMEN